MEGKPPPSVQEYPAVQSGSSPLPTESGTAVSIFSCHDTCDTVFPSQRFHRLHAATVGHEGQNQLPCAEVYRRGKGHNAAC